MSFRRPKRVKILTTETPEEMEQHMDNMIQSLNTKDFDVLSLKIDPNPLGGWCGFIIYC